MFVSDPNGHLTGYSYDYLFNLLHWMHRRGEVMWSIAIFNEINAVSVSKETCSLWFETKRLVLWWADISSFILSIAYSRMIWILTLLVLSLCAIIVQCQYPLSIFPVFTIIYIFLSAFVWSICFMDRVPCWMFTDNIDIVHSVDDFLDIGIDKVT